MAREHIHLIGIGGTAMTALAGLLSEQGCRVTGSDRQLYPPTSLILEQLGLAVHSGFDPAHLRPAPDVVVVGNAISRGNPELEETLDRGLTYTSMPRLIAERFLRGRHSIVVAGTHGKTTTTSMLAWILARNGADPGFLVGGQPNNFPLPFRLGSGPAFVIEGDEYDSAFFDKGPKFMHYRPDTALLGTVEFDHADIYRDLAEVQRVFRRFTRLVPRRGLLVRHDDCGLTREVSADAPSRVQGYGLRSGTWQAADLYWDGEATGFRVLRDGTACAEVRLGLGGEHNVLNALAALAAAVEQGIDPADAAAALGEFRGVRRRLDLLGEVDGVAVYDDFAHHPTAIRATLDALRRRHPDRRLWAVFEPRSWSLRRNVFQDRLPEAFDPADRVLIADVYRADDVDAEQRLDVGRLVADIATRGGTVLNLAGADSIVPHLERHAAPGDVVAVLSNGGFDGLHRRLLGVLEQRAAQAEGGAGRGA